ncbi:MAG: UDP-N-acetylmuramoyl-L-alanine--D-glutamate ligase [Candidatus Kapaibacteriales bacterium]
MELRNIFIVGAGRSGRESALLARRKGFDRVFVSEISPEEKFLDTIQLFEQHSIEYEFGLNSVDKLNEFDFVVVSPGVPPSAEIIKKAESLQIPILSEIEFAYRFNKSPIIAITGTNGKTTTTALVNYILRHSGLKSVSAGNIGFPFSSIVDQVDSETIIALELSSYQLMYIVEFRPEVAIILNLTPDHLSYHGSYEKYKKAKFRIFENQKEQDLLILNAQDDELRPAKLQARGQISEFGLEPVEVGAFLYGDDIVLRFPSSDKEEKILKITEIKLPGVHNLLNSLAAIIAVKVFHVSSESIRDSLRTFEGVEHRLEWVRRLDGVDYVNDSKATNVESTYYALSSYVKPIIWIAGGRADNNDYTYLDEVVIRNVKAIIAIGEDKKNIFFHFLTKKKVYLADTLEEAVLRAREISELGDVVLLSPACKSFDMFRNFEHRGNVFKQIVNSLK